MIAAAALATAVDDLRQAFPEQLQENVSLAPYTAARIGGSADALLTVRSREELLLATQLLWKLELPFQILGGGSNVLVSDRGVRGVVVLNQAKEVHFESDPEPSAWAESGVALGALARRAVERGWAGLEWAASIPGTVGGAVVGNAGAHGGDVAGSLLTAEILTRELGPETWSSERLDYDYRTSWLKRNPGQAVVLSATFRLEPSDRDSLRKRLAEFIEHRQATQPTGASWGSMFKNPKGDYAGRLIEAAGLKGERRGAAEISELHANFFLNRGGAQASDVRELIQLAKDRVAEEFGIELELEIELMGEWDGDRV